MRICNYKIGKYDTVNKLPSTKDFFIIRMHLTKKKKTNQKNKTKTKKQSKKEDAKIEPMALHCSFSINFKITKEILFQG